MRRRRPFARDQYQGSVIRRLQPCPVPGGCGKPEAVPASVLILIPDPCPLTSRKEVIQPQVPLRLPCYDFTPVADLTVVGWLPRSKSGGCGTAFG
jgi:hypothetical protein